MSSEFDIEVKNGSGTVIASGTLEVDTSVTPNTGTFTPDDGTAITCTNVNWPSAPGSAVSFTFQVQGQANGDFPAGPHGNNHTYHFNGNQNASGDPGGNVNFPSNSPTGDDDDTWIASATVGEEEEAEATSKGTYGATAS